MLMAAMLLPFASQAQNTLTVADGTTTNSYVPVYGLYVDDFVRCQTIYPASEIASSALAYDMTGGTITGLTYYLSTPAAASWGAASFVVKMMEVTSTTLSSFVDMTNATTVYTGSLDATQSTMEITFSTPYVYQGGNLLIEIYNTLEGTYKSASFYGVNATGASWQGYNGTSVDNITGATRAFIPKTTFTFTGGTEITCRRVTNLHVDDLQTTSSSLTLSWTDDLNTSATYSVYAVDSTGSTLVQSNITDTTYTVTGLNANTEYTFGVVANCSATDEAAMQTTSGRTACSTISLPYTDGFEAIPSGSYQMPFCWSRYTSAFTTTTTYPYSYSSNAHTGSRSLYFYGTTDASYPDTMVAIMPQLDVTAFPMNGNRVTFWAKMGAASNSKNVYVGTMTDPTNPATFTLVDSVLVSGNTYTMYSVPLNNANATDSYVAFVVLKGTGTMYIDDVTLEEMPSCLEITNLAASDITSSSITLTWNDNANSSATYTVYNMADTTVIASNITATPGTANGISYTVTGLDANTQYTFGVQANCTAGDAAIMTVSVRTNCDAEELPFVETFDATLSSNQCWRGANNATAAQVFSGTALTLTSLSSWTYASSARDGLEAGHYYKNVYGTNQKAWMITPAIDLTNVSSAQLSFDVALTDYNNAALPDVNGDTNNSQAFMVIVSTDGGNTWSANNATIWQNEGGDYTYASLASTTYQNKVIDLTQYVGNTIKIAFYTQSIWTGGDNDLHIDNIAVTQASSCPAPVVTVDNFMNRTVSFSWTSTADSVIVGLFNNDGQQIAGWFAPATGSITNYNLPETYFPFGVGYVVAQSICGDYADNNLSSVAYDVFAVTCNEEEQCPVTFLLTDGYGDGWNGGALDIYDTVSGLIVGSMACPDYGVQDSSVTYTTTYSFCPGRVYSIVYRSGQYDDEVSFTILGPDSTVYGSFSNPTAGVLGYFTHTCPAPADPCLATIPFAESFESGELGCWTTDGNGTWSVGTGDYSSSTGAHTGTYNAKITHGNTGDATKLISPVINMTGVANAELRFWHVQRSWTGDIDQLAVYYRTSATGDWQNLATYTGAFATWTEEVISLPNLSSTYQVAFEMTDSYGYGVAIDDITIDLPPACAAVTALTASAVTNNSITLEWTDANNTGATYTVYEVNPTGETLLASNISGTTYTVTNLTGHTSYTFGVVANCTADASSTMATLAVTTMPDPIMCGDDEALTFSNADNVTGTTSYYPGYSYYNYSYSEVIIPLTRLIGLGEIKGMEYYVNSIAEGSSYFNNCEIYLMNTTATTLSDGFIQDTNNLQLVYSGDLNQTETGWKLVTFDSSFMYDGASNLLVAVRRNHGSYASSGSFGSYTADAQLARYVYRDASAYEIGTITGGTAATNVPVYHMIGCAGNAPDCMPISNLTASDLTTTSVTLNWVDNNNTGATYTVYNDNNVVASGITTTTYNVTGLTAETNYNFSVVANCTATAESMPISISVFTGYCAPTPTSVDGSGITSVAFGGMTNTTSHAGSTAAYVNNSTMAGSVPAGTTATVDITFATGYTYGTIIWVDWDNSLTFEGNEVVYVGTSENSNPTTLTATFDIPATQANGNYRMRILAADSYFDSYTGSIEAAANANPCASYSWGVAEDYTLLVGDAPSCLAVTDLTVSNATANTVTLTWTDALNTGATYSVYEVNATGETLVASNISGTTYTVTGLTATTGYTFGVVANCSATDASSMVTVSATTDCAGGSCNIYVYAQDAYGDGWNGATINFVQAGSNVATYSMAGQGLSSTTIYDTATVSVCAGVPISFNWTSGAWDSEISFDIANALGEIVMTVQSGSSLTSGETFLTLDSCNAVAGGSDTTITDCIVTTLPYVETFDAGNAMLNCWTILDADGDGHTWELYNGGGSIYSESYYNPTSTVLTPDNWLITPQITLPAGGNYEVSWSARPQDTSWAAEHYGLYVSTTTTDTTAFTLLQQWTLTSSDNPVIPVVNLNAYAGQNIYLALRHWNCTDMFMLIIDDFTVREQLNANQVLVTVNTNNAYYGNVSGGGVYTIGDNVTVTATPNTGYAFVNWTDANNSVVSTANPYTFVAATNVTLTANFSENTTPQDPDSAMVTIAVNDATMGTVTPAPGTYMIPDDSVLTLTATAVSGYHFLQWNVTYYYNDNAQTQTFTDNPLNLSNLAAFSPLTFTAIFEEDLNCNGTTCDLVVSGIDSWGDGWNGGILSVMQNNVLVSNFTVDTTGATASIEVCSDYPVDFVWNSGSYDDEVSFTVSTVAGTQLFAITNVASLVNGNVFASVATPCTTPVVTFVHDTLTFTTAINDATMGSITPAPGTYQYLDTDTLFLSATPNYGYHFVEWNVIYNYNGTVDTTALAQADLAFLCSALLANQPLTFTAIFAADTLAIDCSGNTCYLTIEGQDGYGDGWNGAEIIMMQNDTVIGNFTLSSGSSNTTNFMVCSNYPVSMIWSSGNYDVEISFTVSNSYGQLFNITDASILNDTLFAVVNNVCSANATVDLDLDVDSLTIIVGVNDATMGTTNPVPGTYQISYIETMTLSAIPNTGYYFHGWAYSYNYEGTVYYDTVIDATLSTFDIEGDYWAEVTPVTFIALFSSDPYVGDSMLVNIAVNDPTMGTTNPAPGAHYFYEGETCSVVAMPYPGYMIEGWYVMALEDGDTVIDEYVPYPFTDVFEIFEEPFVVGPGYGDIEFYVTAHFTEDTSTSQEEYLTFITAVNDATMGTVTPEPGTHYYYLGDVINFSATPYEGYHAESADITVYLMGIPLIDSTVSLGNMTTFDLEVEEIFLGATISITVNFASGELEEAILNVDVNNANMGYVLVNGEQTATYVGAVGETVTLEAVANNGFAFQSWSDGNTSANRDLVLYDAVTSITANFIQNEGIDIAGMLNDLKVYPNPTHGIVNIDAEDVVKVEVMDLNGRVAAVYENSNRVDLSDLNAGTYMLRIQTTNGTAVRRVVKK